MGRDQLCFFTDYPLKGIAHTDFPKSVSQQGIVTRLGLRPIGAVYSQIGSTISWRKPLPFFEVQPQTRPGGLVRALLRVAQITYIVYLLIAEQRRAVAGFASLKSMHFVFSKRHLRDMRGKNDGPEPSEDAPGPSEPSAVVLGVKGADGLLGRRSGGNDAR